MSGDHAQTMEALDHANEIRLERAKVKREIRASKSAIHTVLIDPPSCMLSISVLELLECQKGFGSDKAMKLLNNWPNPTGGRSLGSLTDRERRLLSEQVKKKQPSNNPSGGYKNE